MEVVGSVLTTNEGQLRMTKNVFKLNAVKMRSSLLMDNVNSVYMDCAFDLIIINLIKTLTNNP